MSDHVSVNVRYLLHARSFAGSKPAQDDVRVGLDFVIKRQKRNL